ncbi:MAG: UDP-N-acetylmuramoyl-L-alanine--D-glutamate ligase [Actinomycetota bacterium]|nr:UDP-N-acetylmuramoyl-L-alanine--D-glutamate ligase [Actinomycetota bacterium]
MGLARSGQAAARLLAERGERVIGVDSGKPDGIERLRDTGVEVHLDGGTSEWFEEARCVVKSPGVPLEAPPVRHAVALGIPVVGELELAWRLLPNPFVAVTGTNGKTTVTELLGHIWRTAGAPVAVAGNVGMPLASLPGNIDPAATVVCETSSFQLEDAVEFAPECALLLNATPDHLDRHGSFEHYLASKLRVFACQDADDVALADRSDPQVAPLDLPGEGREVDVSRAELSFEPAGAWIRGAHNAQNARFAAVAAIEMGIDPVAVEEGIASFPGVAHRLEHIADIDGISYVNDSKATNVAAAVAALRSFDGGVHALMGGSLKGGGFELLREPVSERCAAVYLTGPAGDPIAAAIEPTEVDLVRCVDLPDALSRAHAAAAPGQTVLLAPACASFDAYSDYEARGDHFRELVRGIGATL